jgi:hypothetical protein
MLCYVMLRYVMLCYIILCYVMLCYVMLCYVMIRHVLYLTGPEQNRPVFSCLVLFVSHNHLFDIYCIFCRYFQLLDSTVGPPLKVITTSYLPANAR